jgi:hypothetical protein
MSRVPCFILGSHFSCDGNGPLQNGYLTMLLSTEDFQPQTHGRWGHQWRKTKYVHYHV